MSLREYSGPQIIKIIMRKRIRFKLPSRILLSARVEIKRETRSHFLQHITEFLKQKLRLTE